MKWDYRTIDSINLFVQMQEWTEGMPTVEEIKWFIAKTYPFFFVIQIFKNLWINTSILHMFYIIFSIANKFKDKLVRT